MKIVILGAGESGVGTAILAQKKGYEVFVSDMSEIKPRYADELTKRGIEFEQKQHTADRILDADIVMKSPGIPDKAPIVQALKAKNIEIVSELEFAKRYTDAKTICITGSNGKTTTTMLTYFILQQAGLKVGLAGNIGKSFAWQVAEQDFDYYVLEISSFQLDGMFDFRADIALLLNVTPDHLDRYNYKFQEYINSKFRILQNMTSAESFIYWSGDPVIMAEVKKRNIEAKQIPFNLKREENAAWIDGKNIVAGEVDSLTIDTDLLNIKGTHNLYNAMAAVLAARAIGVSDNVISAAVVAFQGVEHRLEYVTTIKGVRYINDSKATNVNSSWYALQSMKTPVVFILGGTDKGNDYSELLDFVNEKVHTLVFMGIDNTKLNDFFSKNCNCTIVDTNNINDAVSAAYSAANGGDTVLLSPCCASFDLFKNYEDRGEKFKQAVMNLQ
ncbi:MAG: UDP-N-acetylmuramoyl-L-alanine--D-glutamate ligase [bacterium]